MSLRIRKKGGIYQVFPQVLCRIHINKHSINIVLSCRKITSIHRWLKFILNKKIIFSVNKKLHDIGLVYQRMQKGNQKKFYWVKD
jgi:hypothetical protein